MKIAYFCNEYPPHSCGGIGVFVKDLATRMSEFGHDVHIIEENPEQRAYSVENMGGVVVHRLPRRFNGSLAGILNRLYAYWRINRIIRTNGIELIEYPDFQSYGILKHSIPMVLRLHGSNTYLFSLGQSACTWLIRSFERRAFKCADVVVGVSDYILTKSVQVYDYKPKSMSVIHNTYSLSESSHLEEKTIDVIFWGTLCDKKGVLELAHSIPCVCKIRPETTFMIIGRDTVENGRSVRDKIVDIIGIDYLRNITILPPMDREPVLELVRSARIAVLPSKAEAFGLTMLEASLAGIPVIAKKCTAIEEVFYEQYPWLMTRCDADQIASAVLTILNHYERTATYTRKQLAYATDLFARHKIDRENLALYSKVIRQYKVIQA